MPLPPLFLLVAALQAAPDSAPAARAAVAPPPRPPAPVLRTGADALRPSRIVAPTGGVRIVTLDGDGSPRVALRLSVPVQEGPSEGGAARVIQLLGLERARSAAAAVGARVEATRTPWGVAYSVEGAAADFDHLAYVLREAAAEPVPDRVGFERARGRALSEALRLRETAAGRVASSLRERVVPGQRLVEGTPVTVQALTPTVLRDVWRRTHHRDRMTLVVAGDIPTELVLASLGSLGAPAGPAPEAPAAPAPSGDPTRTEVIRTWYGEAREAGELRDPRGLVAATLVGNRLERVTDGRTETRLEVWEVGDRRVLAVTAAAYPGEGRGLEAMVRDILAQTASGLGADAVAQAVARVRAGLLLGARTPAGLAALVGRYGDATGDPGGAAALVEALDRVDVDAMRTFMAELVRRTPVRAEVRP